MNEERKASIAENKALAALKNEFEQNIQRFEFICQARENYEAELRAYYELITNDTIPIEIKAKTVRRGDYGGTWSVQNTVLNGLVNSGAIENIQNDSLNTLLTRWPNRVTLWKDQEERWRNFREKQEDFFLPRIRKQIPRSSNGKWDYFPNNTESELEGQRASFVNDLKYQNLIATDISLLRIQSLSCIRIMEDYNQIP